MKCRFNSTTQQTLVRAHYVSPHSVFCYTPPWNTEEMVKVFVTRNLHDYANVSLNFTYHNNVSINSIYPTWGPISGLTEITVFGSNFAVSGKNISRTFLAKFEIFNATMHHTGIIKLFNFCFCVIFFASSKLFKKMLFFFVFFTKG